MELHARKLLALAGLATLAACSNDSGVPSSITAPASASRNGNPNAPGLAVAAAARVCPGAAVGEARCHAWVATDGNANPLATSSPSGYGPSDLASAYQLPGSSGVIAGSGPTVAIVDAYDDPNAEKDLGVYRAQYGLPACTTANGCFKKLNQNGVQGSYPRANGSWSQEISLDLDMVSAVCPQCKIMLVEASSSSFANLSAAVDAAVSKGANAVSNSYGGSEYSTETTDEAHYKHAGVVITVSSGDGGFGVEFPAASQYVTAVGGTSLKKSGTSWVETAWSGAGSGCSAYEPQASWQKALGLSGCGTRMVADVSAIADPNTGVAVYDSYRYMGSAGWMVFGGTSVASPIIASVYALAGNTGSVTYGSFPYSNRSALYDVTSGSNGSCSGTFLCTATTGYDGPTGLGTPRGTMAF